MIQQNVHEKYSISSDYCGTMEVAPPSDHLHTKITLPCPVPSSRIRPLSTAVAAPLHPALSLAYRLMLLMVTPLEYPLSVSSHIYLGLPLLLAPFILPRITSSSISLLLSSRAKSSLCHRCLPKESSHLCC